MRPTFRLLDDKLLEKIIAEARRLICELGVEINNDSVVKMLGDHGARIEKEKNRVFYTADMIEKSLK